MINGSILVGAEDRRSDDDTFRAFAAANGDPIGPAFSESAPQDVSDACAKAADASAPFASMEPARRAAFWLEVRGLRAAVSTLPARLRFVPAYVDARRRMQGKGPDRVGRWLEQFVVRHLPQAAK